MFLECLDAKTPEKLPERWHRCVHFALGIANAEDPTIQKHQRWYLGRGGKVLGAGLSDVLLTWVQMRTTGTARRKAIGVSTR